MKGLRRVLTEEAAFVLEQLKLTREQAIDYKNMKQISAIFEGSGKEEIK